MQSLTQIAATLRSSLGLSPRLSVSETLSAACAELGITPQGSVRADAIACIQALPKSAAPRSTAGPVPAPASPVPPAVSVPVPAPAVGTASLLDALPESATNTGLIKKLEAFYHRHNPDKTPAEIADIVLHYEGKEKELVRKLEKKYNTTFES